MLIRLIYASRAARDMTVDELRALLTTSRERNAAVGLTGMLCYDSTRFLQYLEGEREAVNAAYGRIMRDTRHNALLLLDYRDIQARLFGDWDMGYVDGGDPDTELLLYRATASTFFQPDLLAADDAVELVRALKDRAAPQIEFV